jgi:hypothetical protein
VQLGGWEALITLTASNTVWIHTAGKLVETQSLVITVLVEVALLSHKQSENQIHLLEIVGSVRRFP